MPGWLTSWTARLMAVWLLVPALFLGSSGTATAAPGTSGEWVPFKVNLRHSIASERGLLSPGYCEGNTYVSSVNRLLTARGVCTGKSLPFGAYLSAGHAYEFRIVDSAHAVCSEGGGLFQEIEGSTWYRPRSSFVIAGSDCGSGVPVQLCIRAVSTSPVAIPLDYAEGCVEVDVPADSVPDDTPYECTKGGILGRPDVLRAVDTHAGPPRKRRDSLRGEWRLAKKVGTTGYWQTYFVIRPSDLSSPATGRSSAAGDVAVAWDSTGYYGTQVKFGDMSVWPETTVFTSSRVVSQGWVESAGVVGKVVGYGLFWSSDLYAPGTNAKMDRAFTDLESVGRTGVTPGMPSGCQWYWGEQIAQPVAGSTSHQPMGPGPVSEPGASEVPEPPVIEDDDAIPTPETEGGFWAAVLALFAELIGAVGDIVGMLLSGLKWLFIPSGSGWDVGGLMDQVESRAPFSLLMDLGDEAELLMDGFATSGNCGTLTDFGGGLKVKCADVKGITSMNLLYQLVQAGLVGGTIFAGVRMVSDTVERGQ